MSRKGDIRMHVEHLFEGRTLTSETIELKEEIYGNLVARYEDYVAQGMTDDEAFRRTCEAVGSLDDVLGEDGENNEKDAGPAADDGTTGPSDAPEPDATFVSPDPDAGTVPPGPPAPDAPASAPKKRWPTLAIVAVAVAAVLVVGMVVVTVFNVLNTGDALDAYDASTSTTTQPVDTDGSTTYVEPTETDQTTTGQSQGNQSGSGAQNGSGQGSAGATGLDAEVYAHSVDELAARSGAALGSGAVRELAQGLPLGGYLTDATEDAGAGSAELTYTYEDRDRVSYDDDCIDRAIVYDVVALMSTVEGLNTVQVVEVENDGHDYDRDRQVFRRETVEGILGIPLNSNLLAADLWDATRDQVMTKRYWDPIWESADVD